VPRTATGEEVKRAYRRMARTHHPDLQGAAQRAQSEERFKEANEAYEVLSDPEKRSRYDALGADWKAGMNYAPPGGEDEGAGRGSAEWDDAGFSDFFSSLFGRRPGGGAGGRAHVARPGADVEAELPVTLEQLMRGGMQSIRLGGKESLEVEIPRWARDGTILRLVGRGQPGYGGGRAGDLYLRLRLMPHLRYRVRDDDLETDLPLWPWQAVLGDEVSLDTPDAPVNLKVPPGTQSGRRLRLRGRGLPRADGARGDLHAVARILVPDRPNEAEREAYRTLKRQTSRSAAPTEKGA
jgi:curved DNA-binding protein